jgi:hypothetical protein
MELGEMLEDSLMLDQLDFLEILSLAHFGCTQEVTIALSFLNPTNLQASKPCSRSFIAPYQADRHVEDQEKKNAFPFASLLDCASFS